MNLVSVHRIREVIYGAYRIVYHRGSNEVTGLTVRRGSERPRQYELHEM